MKKILVIGAGGFVGQNVPKTLIESNHVLAFDKQGLEVNAPYSNILMGDLLDQVALQKLIEWGPDVVINLAGTQYASPIQKRSIRANVFSKNVEIAESLRTLAESCPAVEHLIHISTDMIYGIQPSGTPIKETAIPNPIGPYGISKLASERILLEVKSASVTILRPRLIVGQGREGTVGFLARIIRTGLPVPIVGNGHNIYQMISVNDLWFAITQLISTKSPGIFNIGSDNSPTLNELIPKTIEKLGYNNLLFHLPIRLVNSVLYLLDVFNLSPLAPEQYRLASITCKLDTEKLKVTIPWKSKDNDIDILCAAIQHNLNRKFSPN